MHGFDSIRDAGGAGKSIEGPIVIVSSTLSLETIDVKIDRQRETVARAAPSSRYGEILQLQMLSEMKGILETAYSLRLESGALYRMLTEEPDADA